MKINVALFGLGRIGVMHAENIKLKCVDPKVGVPLSIVINTKNYEFVILNFKGWIIVFFK